MTERHPNQWIKDLEDDEQGRKLLEVERVWLDATEMICELMESKGITKTELAHMLGSSPSNITQILSGKRNLTLKTLTETLFALGSTLRLSHAALDAQIEGSWVTSLDEPHSADCVQVAA